MPKSISNISASILTRDISHSSNTSVRRIRLQNVLDLRHQRGRSGTQLLSLHFLDLVIIRLFVEDAAVVNTSDIFLFHDSVVGPDEEICRQPCVGV